MAQTVPVLGRVNVPTKPYAPRVSPGSGAGTWCEPCTWKNGFG